MTGSVHEKIDSLITALENRKPATGIKIENSSDVSIIDCTVDGFDTAYDIHSSSDVKVVNSVARNQGQRQELIGALRELRVALTNEKPDPNRAKALLEKVKTLSEPAFRILSAYETIVKLLGLS